MNEMTMSTELLRRTADDSSGRLSLTDHNRCSIRRRGKMQICRKSPRRGLAPMEFVLWLPVLMLVTALMVNFGTMAAWRLRGEVVSRDAVWRTSWPRTGANEPRPHPRVWPVDASMDFDADVPINSLDDTAIQHPVVRGPLPNGFVVKPILDPDERGSMQGTSAIERRFPMLPRLGTYESGEIRHPQLQRRWSVAEMGILSNESRRVPWLYDLPRTPAQFPQAFVSAVQALFNMARFNALRVLDNDADFIRYVGTAPDFHPRISYSLIFTTDPAEVRQRRVLPLVDVLDPRRGVRLGRISQLPLTMANSFLNMYRIARLNGATGLDVSIQQLQDYINMWPAIEQDLKNSFLRASGS